VARFLLFRLNFALLLCARRFSVYLIDRLPTAARATGTNEEPEPLAGNSWLVPGAAFQLEWRFLLPCTMAFFQMKKAVGGTIFSTAM
jgi:hypothetical protein